MVAGTVIMLDENDLHKAVDKSFEEIGLLDFNIDHSLLEHAGMVLYVPTNDVRCKPLKCRYFPMDYFETD
ncbi:MAG: hypothetical protein WCB46_10310 [Methanoregula sp.]